MVRLNGFAYGVAVSENRAYLACYEALHILDVSNPTNPQELGRCVTPPSGYAVTISGNYAYVAEQSAGMQVIDISNAADPRVAW
ncbi:MAG: hypothetical protein KJ072_03205 [Verrucomicrobia bacterium]|nr:hypothetical protein [Verrucomicrobiota bacterium]